MNQILEDIRVVDLTDFVFGPYCTMILASHGADVIKIEPPWGNTYRLSGTPILSGGCPSFHAVNFNKRGMAINLKEPLGLEVVKKLVRVSDIVIQNFLPGVMERLGLGYDQLKKLNPNIIYAALSGFGQSGPYAARALRSRVWWP
jgi:formyl-CoA transferase